MESYVPDNRFAGSDEAATTEITIASGHDIPALQPLGQVASTGEFVPWDPAATNGSEVAVRMTVSAINTIGGAKTTQAYKSGTFNADQVQWPNAPSDVQKLTAFVGTPISVQKAG